MALIDIPLKGIIDTLTSNEFNQLLEALKLGTRSIKTVDVDAVSGSFSGDVSFLGNVDIGGQTGPYSKYFEFSKLIYVSENGGAFDSVGGEHDGSSPGKAISTFQDAIDNAETILGSPLSTTNRIVVFCIDAGVYSESITCLDYVDIFAPNATLILGGGSLYQMNIKTCNVRFAKIIRNTGSNDLIYSTAANGNPFLEVGAIIDYGSGIAIHNRTDPTGPSGINVMYGSIGLMEIRGGGIGISDNISQTSYGQFNVNIMTLYSHNCVGLRQHGPGLSVNRILRMSKEFLPVTGTTGFQISDGKCVVSVSWLNANTAYNVSGSGVLKIITQDIQGTKTVTGGGSVTKFNPDDFTNVDNTSDLNKPISTATQSALDLKAASVHVHPYEPVDPAIQTHITDVSGNPHMIDKSDVGLSNVDNTSDINKPISSATQLALDLKSNTSHSHSAFPTLQVGNVGAGNYTEFESDGTTQLYGEATAWEDITGSVLGASLSDVIGTAQYDWSNNSVTFGPSGNITLSKDRTAFTIQKPHKAKTNSALKLHVHWEQTDNTTRQFTLRYRIQQLGAAKTTAWTNVVVDSNTNNVFAYVSGTLNQITNLVSIDMTGTSISTQIQVHLTRSDAVAGLIHVSFIDFHYEIDTIGSRQEFTK